MIHLQESTQHIDAQADVDAAPALVVERLTVSYNGHPALDNVSFSVPQGMRVAIIGPNGAGKSTLIKTIMGLETAQAGRVDLLDKHVGYVAQNEGVDWSFPVTVRDVVMMGLTRRIGWLRMPGRDHWRMVDHALERVGLLDLGGRQIGELSGGQRRRVFIARALVRDSTMLLLDEPFSGVDASAQSDMMNVLDNLNREGITIILCTHDLGLAFNRFERVLALHRHMIAYGTPAEVYRPDVLAHLYGGKLATWDDGRQVMVFVDDHGCANC